jgi:hypothetical protein
MQCMQLQGADCKADARACQGGEARGGRAACQLMTTVAMREAAMALALAALAGCLSAGGLLQTVGAQSGCMLHAVWGLLPGWMQGELLCSYKCYNYSSAFRDSSCSAGQVNSGNACSGYREPVI